jgi:hypothetical protein
MMGMKNGLYIGIGGHGEQGPGSNNWGRRKRNEMRIAVVFIQ